MKYVVGIKKTIVQETRIVVDVFQDDPENTIFEDITLDAIHRELPGVDWLTVDVYYEVLAKTEAQG